MCALVCERARRPLQLKIVDERAVASVRGVLWPFPVVIVLPCSADRTHRRACNCAEAKSGQRRHRVEAGRFLGVKKPPPPPHSTDSRLAQLVSNTLCPGRSPGGERSSHPPGNRCAIAHFLAGFARARRNSGCPLPACPRQGRAESNRGIAGKLSNPVRRDSRQVKNFAVNRSRLPSRLQLTRGHPGTVKIWIMSKNSSGTTVNLLSGWSSTALLVSECSKVERCRPLR